MTADVFLKWLQFFVHAVKHRPVVLILDGHRSHVSPNVILFAQQNGISLLKLPSHTTHYLQPCDVSIFRPLKVAWNKSLTTYQREHGFRQLVKSEQVNLLCSVWNECLSTSNVKSGFRKTGIYPIDRSQYPTSSFDPLQLASYKSQHSNSQHILSLYVSTNADTSTSVGPSTSAGPTTHAGAFTSAGPTIHAGSLMNEGHSTLEQVSAVMYTMF
jgi:hypothetical protein